MKMRKIDVLTNLKGYDGYQYSNYGLCEPEALVCIEAIEKQIPEEYDTVTDADGNRVKVCRKCACIVEANGWYAEYCPHCGQAVKWEEGCHDKV